LIEYDPAQPFDNADILKSVNPKHLHGYGKAHTLYGRPLAVLAHPDGAHVLLSGIPNRGLVGGGLLIYNIRTGKEIVLSREDLIPDQCANTMAALPNGDIIVGTSIEAGTGGTSVATRALLYRLDWKTKKLTDQWPMTPATSEIRDLLVAADGLVYGLTGNSGFFVFDPERSVPGKPGKGHIVHYEKMTQYGNVTGSQAPRVMKLGPDGKIYVLFLDAIACIEPGTFTHREVARPGIPIHTGIAIANGRIYFASGTKLWSVKF